MKRLNGLLAALLISNVAYGQTCQDVRSHPDYVPDAKTAEAIGKTVLVARFGEGKVEAQLPLYTVRNVGDYWMVQGGVDGKHTGGGIAVWINAHSGCIEGVFEHMK